MGFSKPPGVPCPPRNPHCQGLDPVSASIDNIWIISALIITGLILAYLTIKKHRRV